MKVNLIKRPDGLLEYETETEQQKTRWQAGEVYEATIRRVRDGKNHRRYFQMIQIAFENQDDYDNQETFRKLLEMTAGYFETVISLKGQPVYMPLSIAYEAMDEDEFTQLRTKVADVICKRLNIDEEELQEQILKLGNYR